ncbi:MAG: EamA family transporter, partial [Chloroflexi bacterium]
YNFATQDVVKKYATFTVIFWQTLFGMAALLPLALTEVNVWRPLSTAGLLGDLYLGVFCSVGAFLLYGYGLKSLRPGLAVNLLNLVPVFGLVFAVILLGEKIGLAQILGGLIVIGGVTMSLSTASKTDTVPKAPEAERGVEYNRFNGRRPAARSGRGCPHPAHIGARLTGGAVQVYPTNITELRAPVSVQWIKSSLVLGANPDAGRLEVAATARLRRETKSAFADCKKGLKLPL